MRISDWSSDVCSSDLTDAIEARNSKLHRAEQTRGYFPGNEAAMKLPYLVSTRRSKNGNGHRASDQKKPVRRDLQRTVHFLTTTIGPAHKITVRQIGRAHV